MRIFLQETSNLVGENKLMKFIILVIGAMVFYNTVRIGQFEGATRTVLVPSGFSGDLEVMGNGASDEYLSKVVQDITGLAFNYTHTGARRQFKMLLNHYTVEAFPSAEQYLYDLAGRVETTYSSSVFYPERILVDPAHFKIEVSGVRRQWSQNVEIGDLSGVRTYSVPYKIDRGRFLLTGPIEEKEEK
ncbi:MAG: TraE/TraK family type IV conjugative transfer system protein [Candidatus Manganitrophaceae bacterium]